MALEPGKTKNNWVLLSQITNINGYYFGVRADVDAGGKVVSNGGLDGAIREPERPWSCKALRHKTKLRHDALVVRKSQGSAARVNKAYGFKKESGGGGARVREMSFDK
jgi:hypothetical protein